MFAQENFELSLPETKQRKYLLVYIKIIFFPLALYILALLAYFGYFDFKIQVIELVLMACILFLALIFARHNAEYAFCIFEQQKDEFKQALKHYIMKNFVSIGKETKSNASFDNFASAYIAPIRNDHYASIALSVFATMGILGTFISLALLMPQFQSSNLSSFEQDLSVFLSNISTAFCISVYGIFCALWWVFFEKMGQSKIQKLLQRQKKSTSSFFWTKEELEQRYLTQGIKHFEKIAFVFEQVSNEGFFKELDSSIERKFGLFQDMLGVEEKAIRVSSEHIKQTMNELNRAHRNQRDLSKIYLEMTANINTLNQSLKELSTRLSEQYNRLLDLSSEKTSHLDKTIASLDEKIESFKRNFEHYQDLMLQNQEKIFIGFKNTLLQGMREFKEVYEEEKSIDDKIEMMSQLKAEMNELDNEASQLISKLNKDDK